ncbi:MAG: FAD-binding oxidoreductase [Armatimonadota bacterium]
MRDIGSAIESIQREVGSDVLVTPADPTEYAVDGIEPLAVARPADAVELADVLRLAGEHRVPVFPRGAGFFSHLGAPLSASGIAIPLERLNAMVAYEPADLTVTVQSGMTLGALQRYVAECDQCLPLDPLCPDGATIGGIVAANASGPSRFRYGTVSDMVLGVRAIAMTGEMLSAGGRVVKNVAGYDLGSLLVGSLGTLAVLAELTFKVWPRPAARLTMLGRCASCEQAQEAATALIGSQLEPVFIELLNANALLGRGDSGGEGHASTSEPEHAAAIVVGFDGSGADVTYQRAEAESLLQRAGVATQSLDGDDGVVARMWLRTILRQIATGPTGLVTMRLSVLSSDVGTAIAGAQQLASDFDWRCAAQAHAGNGIVHIVAEAPSPTDEPPERVAGLCEGLREEAEGLGGWAIIERAPAGVKELAGVWGKAAPQGKLTASIKEAFDPAGILSPGRLPDGR